jgi:predicted MFS family arabinose efflux permease
VPQLVLLLVLTFIESLATILVERGSYFYCKKHLLFSDAENLWLALAFGLAYVFGALTSHSVSTRLGEKRVLVIAVISQGLVSAGMAWVSSPAVLFAGMTLSGLLNGQKWPIVESYVTAGQTPLRTARTLGYFNFSWAIAVPAALVVAGPLIEWRHWGLFALAGALNVVTLVLAAALPPRPVHLAQDHPERPQPHEARRLSGLMHAARFIMLTSYSSMWVLAALFPGIFVDKLGRTTEQATAYSAALDVTRLTAFVILGAWAGWHGRRYPLIIAMPVLAGGFSMVIFGTSLGIVLGGELMFGAAAGIIYFSALYYAIVVKNASVEAGGGHEGLIGSGFALGPIAGLIGVAIEPYIGSRVGGILLAVAPIFCICYFLAARSLIRLGRPVEESR